MKITEKVYKVVDYADVEKLIVDEYKPQHRAHYAVMPDDPRIWYNIVAAEEWGNDSDHTVRADGTYFDLQSNTFVSGRDPDVVQTIDDWVNGRDTVGIYGSGGPPSIHDFFNDLVAQGKLEAGTYLIQVGW